MPASLPNLASTVFGACLCPGHGNCLGEIPQHELIAVVLNESSCSWVLWPGSREAGGHGRKGLQVGSPMCALGGGHLNGGDFSSSLGTPAASRPTDSRQMIQDCPNPHRSLASPSQMLAATQATCPDANIGSAAPLVIGLRKWCSQGGKRGERHGNACRSLGQHMDSAGRGSQLGELAGSWQHFTRSHQSADLPPQPPRARLSGVR